jgi:hypothetical protein
MSMGDDPTARPHDGGADRGADPASARAGHDEGSVVEPERSLDHDPIVTMRRCSTDGSW